VEITEVRVKLIGRRTDKLRAFCSVTFDNAFVIRDLKVIEGAKGAFVAMPSRKICDRCQRCGCKNHLRAKFCNDCGGKLPGIGSLTPVPGEGEARVKLHADIAHPINAAAREAMQRRIIEAYSEELEKAKLPGYKPVEIYESSEEYDL